MILLDTHVLLWLSGDSARLSSRAVKTIKQARARGGSLAVSCITLFEAASVISRGRAVLSQPLDVFLNEIEKRFVIKPINARIAAAARQLPESYPKDPMDRLIGATAFVEDMVLITADDRIRRAGVVQTIW